MIKGIWNSIKEKCMEIKMYFTVMRNSKGIAEEITNEIVYGNKEEVEDDEQE